MGGVFKAFGGGVVVSCFTFADFSFLGRTYEGFFSLRALPKTGGWSSGAAWKGATASIGVS